MNDLIPLAEARNLIPGAPCLATIRRWIYVGVRGKILPTRLVGGRRFVSRAAIAEFISGPEDQGAA